MASPAGAYLPALDEKPWIGHFLGYQDRKFRFGLKMDGKGLIQPMKDRETPVNERTCPALTVVIEELVPGRDPVMKKIVPGSLETTDPPTDEPGKVTFRGKTAGDASFEVVIENDRGDFAIGGRMLDAGKIKNPLRFSIRASYRGIYYKPTLDKAFEKKVSKDGVNLVRLDGERRKFDGLEEVDAKSEEVNGPGIQEVEVNFSPFMGREFVFKATPNSSIHLWNQTPGPLYRGFSLNWSADVSKDPENKARLMFTVE